MEAQLIFKITLWSRCQYHPHFTEGQKWTLAILSNLPRVIQLAGGRIRKSNAGTLTLEFYHQSLQNTSSVNICSFPLLPERVNSFWDQSTAAHHPPCPHQALQGSRRLPGQWEMQRNKEPEKWEIGVCGNVSVCLCVSMVTVCFGLSQWLGDPRRFLRTKPRMWNASQCVEGFTHGKECPHSKTSYCAARLHLLLLHAPPKTPVLPFLPLKLSQDGQSPEFAVVQTEGQRELLVSDA